MYSFILKSTFLFILLTKKLCRSVHDYVVNVFLRNEFQILLRGQNPNMIVYIRACNCARTHVSISDTGERSQLAGGAVAHKLPRDVRTNVSTCARTLRDWGSQRRIIILLRAPRPNRAHTRIMTAAINLHTIIYTHMYISAGARRASLARLRARRLCRSERET